MPSSGGVPTTFGGVEAPPPETAEAAALVAAISTGEEVREGGPPPLEAPSVFAQPETAVAAALSPESALLPKV